MVQRQDPAQFDTVPYTAISTTFNCCNQDEELGRQGTPAARHLKYNGGLEGRFDPVCITV